MSDTIHPLRLIDFYPSKGMYKPAETICLKLTCEARTAGRYGFMLQIHRGPYLLFDRVEERQLDAGRQLLDFSFQVSTESPAGYGGLITCADQNGQSCQLETAFDVLPEWTVYPRYGFVCDFSAGREDEETTLQTLTKYHLNGLQFYDWQYRHEDLMPPQEDYLDPLNRPQSLRSTKRLIEAAQRHGMAAMPYLAIYAASASFWRAHPEWMLYDANQMPIPFGEDFLGIMNPVEGGCWQEHLLDQCNQVLASLPFDGLQIDQYGDPKTGFDVNGQSVDIPLAFGDFIRSAVRQHPGRPVLFNAVGNWPIETLAASPVTFNYIEIWPPDVAYTDLVRVVRNARRLSGQKPVVIALYIPAARQVNNCLADALIYSSGGSRIELGENGRLLSDPYFPKHEAIPGELNGWLRRAADMMVRYEEWIGPMENEQTPTALRAPEGVGTFFRDCPSGASLCLVNLKSDTPLTWNSDHASPVEVANFMVDVQLDFTPKQIWMVSPDSNSIAPVPLEWDGNNGAITVKVPSLKIWSVLLLER